MPAKSSGPRLDCSDQDKYLFFKEPCKAFQQTRKAEDFSKCIGFVTLGLHIAFEQSLSHKLMLSYTIADFSAFYMGLVVRKSGFGACQLKTYW